MKLSRDFYERDTLVVAKELLGKYLVHVTPEATLMGKIVETEAYCGFEDAAAHSYKGLRSNRTEVMFGPGGYAYVYLIYGMYYCFNIVTSTLGNPEAVLIRALEPVSGIDVMKKNRKTEVLYNLCSGPGKLCAAMGITKLNNGEDLCGDKLFLLDNSLVPEENIMATPRINVDYAGEAKDYPWRFIIKGNKFVSR
ncbi:MAG: DNA-3-methyladenine glycosylase [Clostridiaceae bacterium]|nr:DNA-3-methyladenine glycosylase [Clostridiaceae bacterium]